MRKRLIDTDTMSFRSFFIVIVCRARNINTAAEFANWLGQKKEALFSLIYFFGSSCVYYIRVPIWCTISLIFLIFAHFGVYYIPHNNVIPQAMPHAIPQTHSVFFLVSQRQHHMVTMLRNDKHPNKIADRLAVKVFFQASDVLLLFFILFLILSLFCF